MLETHKMNGVNSLKPKAKDILGLEKYAYVNNSGEVFMKERFVNNNGTQVLLRERQLTPVSNGLGYLQVRFYINNKVIRKYLHRIIAEAFLENPLSLSEINHIDGNKLNNNLSNLEWVSRKENYNHAIKNGLIIKSEKGYFAKATMNQAIDTSIEGAETSGEVESS